MNEVRSGVIAKDISAIQNNIARIFTRAQDCNKKTVGEALKRSEKLTKDLRSLHRKIKK